ncbi:MAG: formate/nitrite transporter family protein [Candidatus Gracilibacteria bacterium]|nr:formate/nitrite transporter family protein [Candidatus Gracilibacteria bacterium]
MDNFYSQKETFEKMVDIGEKKANKYIWDVLILGFMAGAYIGFGGQVATVVATGTTAILGYGMTKLLMGAVFSIALMLVIIDGAELFTGNHLMIQARMKGRILWGAMLKNWAWVYFANFVGAVFVAVLIYYAGLWSFADNHLGEMALKIANEKVNLSFMQAFIRGILANWLVCLAVYIAISSKDIVGKIFGIFFPVMTFVACGFEHSIANMFFIPMGIFIENQPAIVASSGLDVSNLTWYHMFYTNLLPVTIGNIIGGALFVGFLYYMVNRKA